MGVLDGFTVVMDATAAAVRDWAEEEFGHAELGDRRRVDRVVRLASRIAMAPAGTVTAVVSTSAEREGAFRLLSNPRVSAAALADATHRAAVRRAKEYPWVYVAVDGSSLSLTDRVGGREVGCIGAWKDRAWGLLVVSALAVSPDGTPLGICGQQWWARTQRSTRKDSRYPMQGELRYSLELFEQVHARFAEEAPEVVPWYQFDRGFDAWAILQLAHRLNARITVRATFNRQCREHRRAPREWLFDAAQRAPLLGSYELEIPAKGAEPARIGRIEVRACRVTLELRVARKRREYVPMNLVYAKEVRDKQPLQWLLLTTAPVESFADALAVIDGYTARWRIEEFHRAWKRGVCNVEDTQLRSRQAIIKWATLHAAVAARAIRLAYLARERPDESASIEFTQWEIDAVIALLRPKGAKRGEVPSLGQMVRWIADLGGYVGKSSGGPPGPTVIARGLSKVEVAALALRNFAKM